MPDSSPVEFDAEPLKLPVTGDGDGNGDDRPPSAIIISMSESVDDRRRGRPGSPAPLSLFTSTPRNAEGAQEATAHGLDGKKKETVVRLMIRGS